MGHGLIVVFGAALTKLVASEAAGLDEWFLSCFQGVGAMGLLELGKWNVILVLVHQQSEWEMPVIQTSSSITIRLAMNVGMENGTDTGQGRTITQDKNGSS